MNTWSREKLRRESMSLEQRAEYLRKNREYQALRRSQRTEKQRAVELLYFRERQALLTDAEREAQRERGRNLSSERKVAKRKRHLNRPEEQKQKDRIRNRLRNQRKNGFTLELIDQLLREQDGRCAICKSLLLPGRDTHADHCHQNNLPRGMLCGGCNKGIGSLKDSPELLRAAALYIEHWRDQHQQKKAA